AYRQISHPRQPATPRSTSKTRPVSPPDRTGPADACDTIFSSTGPRETRAYPYNRRQPQTKDWSQTTTRARRIGSCRPEEGRPDQVNIREKQLLEGQLTVAEAVEQWFK